jgi:hypothetical protein
VADSAAETKVDAQKRRSARVVQAVPVTVTGVDALGRPFQERTSTVIINCHGCRYHSKHYVLKNMWVTLEVPHSEPGHAPRSVRARVTWIQRPRTVRELFQVGAELETPGNIWGIAFPQHDWFPFPEHAGPEILRPSAELPEQEMPEDPAWLSDLAPPVDNLRILPVAGSGEVSPALAQQIAYVIEEIKEPLPSTVRGGAAQAVAMETGPLLAPLQPQLEQAAEPSAQAIVETAAKRAVQEALGEAALETEARLNTMRQRWSEDLQASVEQARGLLLGQLGQAGQERCAAFGQQLQTLLQQALGQLAQAFSDGEAGLAESREGLSSFRQQAGAVTAAALEEMDQRLRAHAEETQSAWHNRLHADLVAATELWDQRIESSLESASQKTAERLARHSQATAERLENELGSRISSLGKVFAEATAAAEAKLGALRTSVLGETARAQGALSQVQSAALGIEEQTGRFDALTRSAQQELQRRAATVIEAQSRELARRAEGALATWTERLQPSVEAAGQQAVGRLGPQLDQELSARLKPALQACARLERGVAEADQALRRQQEVLAKTSDQAVETARGRLQETLDRMAREIDEAGRTSSAKWLAELDARATETTHTTFESLFKTAEWYEKKVQVQMQAALEKGIEQAGAGLREKAGEISGLFASELDHYNRSYVEHSHSQLEEATRELFERARQQSAELATESMASLTRQAQVHTQAALADVHSQAGAALEQIAAEASAQLAHTRTEIGDQGRRLSAEFREALSSDQQQALAASRRDLTSLAESSLGQLRSEGHAQQAQLAQALAASSDQAIDEYRKRLEVASSSWLLTTVSRLDQQSQQLIEAIAQTAQERLRDACAQAFAEVGENLRRQLIDPPAPARAKGATATSK